MLPLHLRRHLNWDTPLNLGGKRRAACLTDTRRRPSGTPVPPVAPTSRSFSDTAPVQGQVLLSLLACTLPTPARRPDIGLMPCHSISSGEALHDLFSWCLSTYESTAACHLPYLRSRFPLWQRTATLIIGLKLTLSPPQVVRAHLQNGTSPLPLPLLAPTGQGRPAPAAAPRLLIRRERMLPLPATLEPCPSIPKRKSAFVLSALPFHLHIPSAPLRIPGGQSIPCLSAF